jgi:hypothetical protein
MSPSHDLIKSIIDEDFVSAKEITNNLIYMAVTDKLEDAKQEVGANLFGCDDCEEMNEGQMSANRYSGGTLPTKPKKKVSKDYDKDGTVETPKDEVLGSRINAAVKSGNLTPAQAAKTKNKGMYR